MQQTRPVNSYNWTPEQLLQKWTQVPEYQTLLSYLMLGNSLCPYVEVLTAPRRSRQLLGFAFGKVVTQVLHVSVAAPPPQVTGWMESIRLCFEAHVEVFVCGCLFRVSFTAQFGTDCLFILRAKYWRSERSFVCLWNRHEHLNKCGDKATRLYYKMIIQSDFLWKV